MGFAAIVSGLLRFHTASCWDLTDSCYVKSLCEWEIIVPYIESDYSPLRKFVEIRISLVSATQGHYSCGEFPKRGSTLVTLKY